VSAGATAAVGAARTIVAGAVNLAGSSGAWTGTLDVAGGAAAIDYNGTSSPLVTVANQVRLAHDAGWAGGGITSSVADAASVGVGYAESAFALGSSGGTFGGESVDGTSVLLRAVPYGDANLDGVVSGADLRALRRHLGAAGAAAVWQNGDFDYDGRVSARDYAILRRNLGRSLPVGFFSAASIQAVPEPALNLSIPALLLLLLRRRRVGSVNGMP